MEGLNVTLLIALLMYALENISEEIQTENLLREVLQVTGIMEVSEADFVIEREHFSHKGNLVTVYMASSNMQEELGQLTSLWEMVAMVLGRFQEWQQMRWGTINVDFLVEETKKLLKDIKTLQKPIRVFPVYQ